jgi:hypothetical protein
VYKIVTTKEETQAKVIIMVTGRQLVAHKLFVDDIVKLVLKVQGYLLL